MIGLEASAVLALILCGPLIRLVFSQKESALRYKNGVMKAGLKGNWERMYELASRLPRYFPDGTRFYYQAIALSRMGRTEEALQLFEPLKQSDGMPEWVYHFYLGRVLGAGRNSDAVRRNDDKMLELAPNNVNVLMEAVYNSLFIQRDVPRAEKLVTALRTHVIPDVYYFAVHTMEGALALEQQQHDSALLMLTKARNELGIFPKAPEKKHGTALIDACLAMTHSRLGNHDLAKRYFDQARPILEAQGSEKLLGRCRKELGTV
jgi:tetratricopeptide (TPR) repeat protein